MPTLSVCLLTYNHSLYIRQAIEGVLMQNVDFSWEVIIADDHSTDGTTDILREYSAKYPELIKLVLQERNVGAHRNLNDLMKAATGEYIAYFEGDDYWTDPEKLNKQVSLLQKDLQYNMACHLGINMMEATGENSVQPFFRSDIDFYDFAARGCMVHTMSIVFRNLPGIKARMQQDWTKELAGLDLLLFFLLTLDGKKAYCFKEVMGVYRIHGKGMWSSSNYKQRAEKAIRNNLIYQKHLPLSFRQKMYLNFFMKNGLISILYMNNKGVRYYTNKLINNGLFIFGPGIFSGLVAESFYRIVKKKWDLPTY